MEFEKSFNYDDIFLRDVTVSLISQLHNKLRWYNKFDDKQVLVTIPFQYSLLGDERYLMDAFMDDTTGKRPELNIDPLQRAVVLLTSRTTKTSEFSNPNVPIQVYKEIDGQLQKVTIQNQRILPLKLTYDVTIKFSTEIEMFKCEQAIWNSFYPYKYFHFEWNYYRIDCTFSIPDSVNTEIPREIAGLSTEDKKTIKFSIDVNTNFPIDPVKAPISSSRKKVEFRGSIWQLRHQNRDRKWLGGVSYE
jgi:hypothetical protein